MTKKSKTIPAKIKVDANLFRMIYFAVSSEETRYYISGVHIEPHPVAGAIMVATDGHRMVVAHDPNGQCKGTAIVRLDKSALVQCKPPKEFSRHLVIDGKANTATIIEGKNEVAKLDGVLVDGQFPHWRRVVPKAPTKYAKRMPAVFNPKYLADFAKLGVELAKATNTNYPTMRADASDGSSATVFRFHDDRVFGVLMPMRSEIVGVLPSFMAKQAA